MTATSDADLIAQIDALLALDAKGSLVPHGIGGLARELLTKATARLAARPEPDFAASIARVISDEADAGAACGWQSCSGCHETNEGAETGYYPFSALFGCHVGAGCSECGGLGVVWTYWLKDALDAMAAESQPAPTPHPTHRHKLRGSDYALIGIGRMQAENWLENRYGAPAGAPQAVEVDMREVAIYRSVDDGSLWARPREEFEDGRFVILDDHGQPDPKATGQEGTP